MKQRFKNYNINDDSAWKLETQSYQFCFSLSAPKNWFSTFLETIEKSSSKVMEGLIWEWESSRINIVGVQHPPWKGDIKILEGLWESKFIDWILSSATGVFTLKKRLFTNYLSTLFPQSSTSIWLSCYCYPSFLSFFSSYLSMFLLEFDWTMIGNLSLFCIIFEWFDLFRESSEL